LRSLKSFALILTSGLLVTAAGVAGTGPAPAPTQGVYDPAVHAGRATVYQQLTEVSLEQVSTPDRISAVTHGNVAPTQICRVLEHGEKVECLDCISDVAKLLYDSNAKTREISAWWLRRRVFGVFGAGQVYSQVLDTLKSGASDTARAYAAEALGEFLLGD